MLFIFSIEIFAFRTNCFLTPDYLAVLTKIYIKFVQFILLVINFTINKLTLNTPLGRNFYLILFIVSFFCGSIIIAFLILKRFCPSLVLGGVITTL